MLSRIHLALKYEPLGRDAREAVLWRHFLKRAETKHGCPVLEEETINELAEKELNGREVRDIPLAPGATSDYRKQIRNTVLVSRSMAEYEQTVVGRIHLEASLAAREQFHSDFHGGAGQNRHSYF